MSLIYFKYIGEGPENDALVAEVLEREVPVKKARKAIIEEYGADGFVFNREGKPERIGYMEKQDRPYLKQEMKHFSGGFSYLPKKSTKEGRALQAKMDSPDVAFDYNGFILDALKCRWTVYAPPYIASATAGIAQGKIILSVPASDNDRQGEPMPTPPAWMREVTESEFRNIEKGANHEE